MRKIFWSGEAFYEFLKHPWECTYTNDGNASTLTVEADLPEALLLSTFLKKIIIIIIIIIIIFFFFFSKLC